MMGNVAPVILRARIYFRAQARPSGITRGEVMQYLAPTSKAAELAEVLDRMVDDGLLRRGQVERPRPLSPLAVFLPSGPRS